MSKSQVNVLKVFLPIVLLVLGIVGFVALSGLKRAPASSEPKHLAPLVETFEVQNAQRNFSLRVDGEVIPFREIALAAEVGGRISSKNSQARAGNFVEANTRLAEIDPRDYELAVRRIQEQVKQAAVTVEELDIESSNNDVIIQLSQRELELQQNELARIRTLAKNNAASTSDLDVVRRNELRAQNALQTLQNQQRLLRTRRGRLLSAKDRLIADLEQAMLDLERTKIVSPISGIIMKDTVEQDSFVQKGTALFRIEDRSSVEIRFNLRLDQLRWLWSGDDMSLTSDSYRLPPLWAIVVVDTGGETFQWQAQLDRYDGARINAATRTVPCVAVVDHPDQVERRGGSQTIGSPALLRGMFVNLSIEIPRSVALLQLPPMALRPGNLVWLLREGRLLIDKVTVVHRESDSVFVLDETTQIRRHDHVIVSPLALAVQGMELRSTLVTASPGPSQVGPAGE